MSDPLFWTFGWRTTASVLGVQGTRFVWLFTDGGHCNAARAPSGGRTPRLLSLWNLCAPDVICRAHDSWFGLLRPLYQSSSQLWKPSTWFYQLKKDTQILVCKAPQGFYTTTALSTGSSQYPQMTPEAEFQETVTVTGRWWLDFWEPAPADWALTTRRSEIVMLRLLADMNHLQLWPSADRCPPPPHTDPCPVPPPPPRVNVQCCRHSTAKQLNSGDRATAECVRLERCHADCWLCSEV